MKHKGKISISRPSYGDGKKKISIEIEDSEARVHFLGLEMDTQAFAECITGLGHCDCEFEVRGLKNVGKKIETEPLVFEVPNNVYSSNKDTLKVLAEEATPEGWIPSLYFGSQTSFYYENGKKYARTHMSRWVEKTEETDE